jgi:molybdopterin synthase sulfur carrier subunit
MSIKVMIFGGLRAELKRSSVDLNYAPGITVEQIFCKLVHDSHVVKENWQNSILYAINMKHVSSQTEVQDGDEVALMPPMAGG